MIKPMIKPTFFTAVLAAVLWAVAPDARAQGSAKEGARIAKDWCGDCHTVGREQNGGNGAPGFAEIARTRLLSADYLDAWIRNPKPPMHAFELNRRMVDDLVAYIRTLAK